MHRVPVSTSVHEFAAKIVGRIAEQEGTTPEEILRLLVEQYAAAQEPGSYAVPSATDPREFWRALGRSAG